MNCLDFRRRIETAPTELDDALRAHASTCDACAEFKRRVQIVDLKLNAALRAPVPEAIQDRILLRQSFRSRSSLRRMLPARNIAIAAGLLLALAMLLAGGGYRYDELRLEREVVALVEAADYALAATGRVDGDRVAEALRPVGLSLNAEPGVVSFAGRCLVRGNLSGHLVIREGGDPITVFLMPEERLLREARFERSGWRGVLLPAGADGAVAILAPPGKPIDAVMERVRRSVAWHTG